jgi:Na+/proline symporter
MMSENQSASTQRLIRKIVIPALAGGVVGFGASFGLMRFIDSDAVGGLGTSATVAALVGMLYCVIALGILLGIANPRLGARFLNVEDADELREQQRMLLWSGVAMLLWGIALLALALAGPDGPVPPPVALAVGAGGLVIGMALSVAVYRASDELMLAVNLEAGALTYALVLLVVGLWAMLAHLGYAAAPAPLDLLTLFYALVLVASFIAIGRRGMLAVR